VRANDRYGKQRRIHERVPKRLTKAKGREICAHRAQKVSTWIINFALSFKELLPAL